MKGRVSILCPGIPHAERGASSVLFYSYIQEITKRADEVQLILLPGQSATPADWQHIAEELNLASFEVECAPDERLLSLLQGRLGHRESVLRHLRAFGPATVVCLDILSAICVSRYSSAAKIAWLGDLKFDTGWYHFRYSRKEQGLGTRGTMKERLVRMAWKFLYRIHLKQFDLVIVSSGSSAGALKRLSVSSTFLPYPWPNSSTPEKGGKPETPTFLFFGGLDALGSRSAFHYLVEEIYPLMIEEWGPGEFRVQIAGSGTLPDWAARLIEERPEIAFLGFVDSLDQCLSDSHCVLFPIDVPVGNRSRILTAMAKGTIVVAHQNTALGNPGLKHRETALLAHSPEQFLECMRTTIEERKFCAEIEDRATQYYLDHYSPDNANQSFISEIEKVTQ